MSPTVGLTTAQWIDLLLSLILVAAAALLVRWALDRLFLRLLRRLVRRTATTLDDAVLEALRAPIVWLAALLSARYGALRLDFFPARWERPLGDMVFVLGLLIALTTIWRIIDRVGAWYMKGGVEESTIARQWVPLLRRLGQILLVLSGAIMLLDYFEIDVTALVATLGIGTLAIGLAAQESLSDMISGFLIMVDRPYRVGDRVEIQDLTTWGDVVDIGLRSTRVRTRDNRMVIIPNSIMGKSLVVNHSYPNTQYRIQTEIGVAYGTDVEQARQVLVDAVKGVEGVLPDRPVEALFLTFGDSALIFRVRWWIESYVDTRRMYDRVNTAIYRALQQAGIVIPFPQRDVHHYWDGDRLTVALQEPRRGRA